MKKSKMWVCRVGIVLVGLLAAVVFAVDTDTDGMSDGYELFFGLNHTNAADALLDTDGDSVTNLQESILWTDPLFADTDRDGWADSIDANPLSRAVFLWSNPTFATGDSYLYTGPLWWNNAFRVDGAWTTNGWEAGNGLSNNTGSLNIQVLRSLLTNDAVLDVELFDSTNASLYAALCDSNQAIIVNDLYGNIVTGSQEVVIRRLSIPFSSYSNASILRLWRGTGDITVYSSLMYIDEDGDGLDADQELQAGTSDSDADSDDDGLNDFAELFLTDTDPLDADSDDDGYDDQAEVIAESDPNDDQSLPQYAVCFTLPFIETFEERSAGDLNGQHGWEVNDGGVAIVQSNTVFNGEQALSVTDASVSHEFTDAQTNVWVSYRLKAVSGSEPQDLPADMAVVFYVNSDSVLCAYSNQTAVTLPVTVSNDWNRFDIHSDFSSKRWNMRLNRELVVDNFPFYGSPDAFSILRVDGIGTYMDDVQVVFENPDRDNDGYTNDEETEEGSDPDDPQSLPDDVLIELEQTSLSIPEGGTAQLGVRLSAAPRNASPILVTLVSGDSDISMADGVSLTFTTNNWMTAQQVTLSAAQDADWLDGTAVVRCYSTGRESVEIQVTEEDDEFDPDYSTPWAEPFEELTAGNLNNQRGWNVTGEGTALVQSNTVFAGNQAAAITDASASHAFEDGQTNVWISYRLKVVPGNGPENIPDDMAVVFWVNSDSYLCVYSNQTAVTLPVKVSEDWNRFEFYCDFSSKHWNLRLNRELVVSDFPFYGNPDAFSLIRMDGNGAESTFMDDIQVVLENPDRDNDGYTNDEEVEGGSNPDDANSIPVSEVTVSGVVSYDGSQTGTVHVIATTVSSGWNSMANDQLAAPGAYSISGVPVRSNVWIKAWVDSDGNGLCDPIEPQSLLENPLFLTFSKSGINLEMTEENAPIGDGLVDPPEGSLTEALVVQGSSLASSTGMWVLSGDAVYATARRGGLTYAADLPADDIYQLQLEIQRQDQSSETTTCRLRFALDGEFLTRKEIRLSNDEIHSVILDTPFLDAGEHTVEVFWDNYKSGLSLRVERLVFHQYFGADSNTNGVKDWVENRLMARNTVDVSPRESRVSPVCLEGLGLFADLMQVSGADAVFHGADDRWFANAELAEDGTETEIEISFENGGRVLNRSVQWKETNLLTEAMEDEILRAGDALRLTASLPEMVSGVCEIKINGQSLGTYSIDDALTYRFEDAGFYTVEGIATGTDGQGHPMNSSRTVQIQVVHIEPQVVVAQVSKPWKIKWRPWERPAEWSEQVVVEWDHRLTQETISNQLHLCTMTPEKSYGVIRLGETGPVVAPIVVQGINVWLMNRTYLHYSEIHEDGSFKAETTMIMSPLVPEIQINQRCRGNVSYEDGSRVRDFDVRDFSPSGEVKVVFCHSSPRAHSVCHYTEVYQDGVLIKRNY